MLGLSKINNIIYKKNSKKGIIYFYSCYNFEIIFILLLKIVIIYIKFL